MQTERRAGTRWKRGVECGKRHETSLGVGHSHWSRTEWNSDPARAPPRRVISPVALPWAHPPVCSFLGPPSPRASSGRSGDVSRAGHGQQWRDWAEAVGPRSGGGDLEGGRGRPWRGSDEIRTGQTEANGREWPCSSVDASLSRPPRSVCRTNIPRHLGAAAGLYGILFFSLLSLAAPRSFSPLQGGRRPRPVPPSCSSAQAQPTDSQSPP